MDFVSFEKRFDPLLWEDRLAQPGPGRFSWNQGSADGSVSCDPQSRGASEDKKEKRKERGAVKMISLPYSLTIEATTDPEFFGCYSLALQGFTGGGRPAEDWLYLS